VIAASTEPCTTSCSRAGGCVPAPHAYVDRRRAEGKSDNEIRRSLKRYLARELYRALESPTAG
jgi:hypothetical protein